MLLSSTKSLFVVAIGDKLVGGTEDALSSIEDKKKNTTDHTGSIFLLDCGHIAEQLRRTENSSSMAEDLLEPNESMEEPKYPAAHNIGLSFDRLDLVDGRWISAVAVSRSGRYITVANNFKNLLLYQVTETKSQSHVLLRTWWLSKRTMAITFTSDEFSIVVADKLGDVFVYRISDSPALKPALILGHISVITDVILSPNDQFVLTSDRDEKVRVSHFPLADDIQTFCLDNTAFVTKILIPWSQYNIVLTTSGDGTIRAFDYLSGNQVGLYQQEKPTASAVTDDKFFPSAMDYHVEDNLLLICFHECSEIFAFNPKYFEEIAVVEFEPVSVIQRNFPVRDVKFCGNAVLILNNSPSRPFDFFENSEELIRNIERPSESSVQRLVKAQVDAIALANRTNSLFLDPFVELYSGASCHSETGSLPDTATLQKKPRLDEVLI